MYIHKSIKTKMYPFGHQIWAKKIPRHLKLINICYFKRAINYMNEYEYYVKNTGMRQTKSATCRIQPVTSFFFFCN